MLKYLISQDVVTKVWDDRTQTNALWLRDWSFKKKKDIMFISQQKYAYEILKAFNMLECKMMVSPIEANLKLFNEYTSSKC